MTQPSNQILSVAQMVAAENQLIDAGTSADALMQRAGKGVAQWVWRIGAGRPVTVLCGPGNNGGDGYVIAQNLLERGINVQVVAPRPPNTATARNAASAWAGEVSQGGSGGSGGPACSGGIFVDCLFGSGLSRPLEAGDAALLNGLAARHDYRVAVDLPSGVESDTGALLGDVPRYDLTLGLGAWKFAHWRMPAMMRMGTRRLVDIGVHGTEGAARLITLPRFNPPAADAHKYTRGLVAIIAGEMPGAALLAAEAAMRSGAGYVKLLAEHPYAAASAGLVIDQSDLTHALSDRRINSVLVGSGLGRSDNAAERLATTLAAGIASVIDGDALRLLSSRQLKQRDTPTILTPHEGELTALCDAFGISEMDRLTRSRALATASDTVVVAKGPDTIICAPDGRVALSQGASSWLSVAGSGDSLAGIIASRLATKIDPFDAACQAVALHGEAARIAGAAFTADELARAVGRAYRLRCD